jgi:hypothetical protein
MEIHAEMPVGLDFDVLTLSFVMTQEFRVPPDTRFDVVPGEQLVISRPDSAQREAAVLVRSYIFEEVAFLPMVWLRDEHEHYTARRLVFVILYYAVDGAGGPADHNFEYAGRSFRAAEVNRGTSNLLIAEANGLEIELLRQARYSEPVDVRADTVENETPVGSQLRDLGLYRRVRV